MVEAIQKVLARLQRVKPAGPGQWAARCPAHDDENPSLSVGTGAGGRVLLYCHAGCSLESICEAIGIKECELSPPNGEDHPAKSRGRIVAEHRKGATRKPSASRPGRKPLPYQTIEAATAAIARNVGGKCVKFWTYHKADSSEAFRVLRFALSNGDKTYRPVHRNGAAWVKADPPGLLPLYALPSLNGTTRVWVVEGEKCADTARSIGLTATTSAHGADSARKTDWTPLAGREVQILPDHDKAGEDYAQTVAEILSKLNPPATVKIVRLPGLSECGDIVDFLKARDAKKPDALRVEIEGMAQAALPWMPGTSPVLVSMADVKPEQVRWLWPSRIALGKLTVIAGDPGLGKSFLTLDMAARVSVGGGWPDAPKTRTAPGGVVLLSAEDDPGDTIRPRLDAACADVGRVMLLQAVHDNEFQGNGTRRMFNLAEDLEALESAIAQVDNCRLVIVDPISAYLGKTDSHVNAEVRAILAPLSELAARRCVAVVAVTHFRKGEGAAIYRPMGSLGFAAAARAVYAVARDPQDESGARRFFLPVKNNLGTDRDGLAYRLWADVEIPHVEWENGPVKAVVDDILSGQGKRRGPAPEGREEAADWLRVELANGPRPSQDLFKEAQKEGISKRTLQRAKHALGVLAKKTGFDGQWIWGLPERCRQERQSTPHTDNLARLGKLGALGKNPNKKAGSGAPSMPSKDEECQVLWERALARQPIPMRHEVAR